MLAVRVGSRRSVGDRRLLCLANTLLGHDGQQRLLAVVCPDMNMGDLLRGNDTWQNARERVRLACATDRKAVGDVQRCVVPKSLWGINRESLMLRMCGDMPVFINMYLRSCDDGTLTYYGEEHPPLPYGARASEDAVDARDIDLLGAVVKVLRESGVPGCDVRVGVGTSAYVSDVREGVSSKYKTREFVKSKHLHRVGWDSHHISMLWLCVDDEKRVSGVYVDESLGGDAWALARSGTFHWLRGGRRSAVGAKRFYPANAEVSAQWQQKLATPAWNSVAGDTHSSLVAYDRLSEICQALGVGLSLSTAHGCQSTRGYTCFPASIAGIMVHGLVAGERSVLAAKLRGHLDYVGEKTIPGRPDRTCGRLLTLLVERHVHAHFPDVEVHASRWEDTITTGTAAWAQTCCVCGQADRADALLMEDGGLRHEFCVAEVKNRKRSRAMQDFPADGKEEAEPVG